jgi:hypothetical protein
MNVKNENLDFIVEIEDKTKDKEHINEITQKMLNELRELNVGSVSQLKETTQINENKGLDPVVFGVLIVSIIPSVLSKFLDFLHVWALRREARIIKIKCQNGKNSSYEIEIPASMSNTEFQKWAKTVTDSLTQQRIGK